eukprot:scaffold9022_cov69-Phaeocystis_antarctica.AAC.1
MTRRYLFRQYAKLASCGTNSRNMLVAVLPPPALHVLPPPALQLLVPLGGLVQLVAQLHALLGQLVPQHADAALDALPLVVHAPRPVPFALSVLLTLAHGAAVALLRLPTLAPAVVRRWLHVVPAVHVLDVLARVAQLLDDGRPGALRGTDAVLLAVLLEPRVLLGVLVGLLPRKLLGVGVDVERLVRVAVGARVSQLPLVDGRQLRLHLGMLDHPGARAVVVVDDG